MPEPTARLRRDVLQRAEHRCEYCRLSQERQEASFHIDHVVPRLLDGPTTLENLALACVSCSLRKSARVVARDPLDGEQVALYNPRTDRWPEHFELRDATILGRTPVGRATVEALAMNRPLIVAIRREELARGWRP